MDIPGYQLIDTLGEGSLATVYLAISERMEREVALKLVNPEICLDPRFGESFIYRARLLSELEHPHIVKVFDAGRIGTDRLYLAMAYVSGRTLSHRRFELSLSEQLAVVKNVAEALDYAHSRGCEHGRLTPDNILLCDRNHRVLVTDFVMGRAPVTTARQRSYLSPEQRQGRDSDHRSDLFSLGSVLLLLLRGQELPYDASHIPIAWDAAGSATEKEGMVPPSASELLPEGLSMFQPIVERALAASPDERYQSGAELTAALNEITASQLELASRAQTLAALNEEDSKTTAKATGYRAERETSEASVTKRKGSATKTVEPPSLPAEPKSIREAEVGVNHVESEQELVGTSPAVSETGGLRVWEQDRIENPEERQAPPWRLIASCGLALALVGGVLLAAVLD